MCGICGYVGERREDDTLTRMMEALRHRGPDDEGKYESADASLGFRRLSIIDPAGGKQPVTDGSGDLRLVLNGEIYNFRELRRELEGLDHKFKSDGDAEVAAHAIEQWGTDGIARLDGMFAFAAWDRKERTLLLVRDRLGKKPLWYRHDGARLVFASEGKALRLHPDVPRTIDPVALELYLAYGHVPAPRTIFEGVRKLPPGHWLRFRGGEVELKRYWEPVVGTIAGGVDESAERALHALSRAVKKRLVADVPLGAFLSGGIDSSIIVGLMSMLSKAPVKTFSIGFEEDRFNELGAAKEVAARFRTEHHELVVKPDVAALLPRIAAQYDEPFGDSSALPTWLLSEMTAKDVKVALSGDGGDEGFGGYLRHLAMAKAASIKRVPFGAAAAGAAAPLFRGKKRTLLKEMGRPLAALYRGTLTCFDDDLRRELIGRADEAVSRHIEEPFTRQADPVTAAGVTDLLCYLPDDLLVKVDIASMAHSLEVRCPFLDPEVLQVALAIPGPVKMAGGPKAVLKRMARGLLPASILDRPKQGFAIPAAEWLRGPLSLMAHDLLLDSRAKARGLFATPGIERLVAGHASGKVDHHDRIWALMMFELWARDVIDRPS